MADINVTEEIIDINVTEEVITIEAPTGAYPFPNAVYSVFGRVGAIVSAEGDYNLTQLGDVTLTSPANGQVLKYNGTQWVNSTDADTGITTLNTLTALSQTFATGTSGTDFNIISASSTHTFNFPNASATNRGLLSSADWSTFNNKQNAITLTTTGTSGAATFVSGTLNIPQYQGVLTNPVTGTGTTNTLPKFTGASTIGNSNVSDSGTLITLGSNTTISNGGLQVGTNSLGLNTVRVGKNLTGGTAINAILNDGAIQSDVTLNVFNYRSGLRTAAASFTLTSFTHFFADQTSIGAGSSISIQEGFVVNSNMTGATNNYGFRGLIPSGANRWNLYMDGTAANFLNGSLLIGTTTTGTYQLDVMISGTAGIIDVAKFGALGNGGAGRGVGIVLGASGSSSTVSVARLVGYQETASATANNASFAIQVANSSGTLTEYLRINNVGSVGIGTTSLAGFSLRVAKNITGATSGIGISQGGIIQSDVTSGWGYYNSLSTAAATFTIGTYRHYFTEQGTLGAGSVITIQTGFEASSSLIGGTNNYGFRGAIPAGTNRWNLFMDGTAANYLAGNLGIGTTAVDTSIFRVLKNLTSTTPTAVSVGGEIQSTGTGQNNYISTNATTAAASFTAAAIRHINIQQGTFGAGSTVTDQYGVIVGASMVGATSNFGFFGDIPSGTNRWNLFMNGTANNYMAGSLGIGSTSLAGYTLRASKNITGGTTSYGMTIDGQIQSDVTTQAWIFQSNVSTAAATFNIAGGVRHFFARGVTMGAGSTMGNQFGFHADSSLTTGSSNFAFYSGLAAGTNRWNIYMDGNANNYMAGSLGIGTTTVSSVHRLNLGGSITGAVNTFGIGNAGTIASDVTNSHSTYLSSPSTAAAAFTLSTLFHFRSFQGTIGAGSIITNQYGFYAESNLTGATNNYGFFGNIPSGTNRWNLYMAGTAYNHLAGRLGIGQTFATSTNLVVNLPITGSTTSNGIFQFGTVQSDSTSAAYGFRNQLNTAAAAFTLATYSHYSSQGGGTVGAGSTITSQIGFWAESTMAAQATNNYGFYGSLASATNTWNLYMAGTAANYMAGNLRIGTTTTDGTSLLEVAGNVNFNGSGSRSVAITRDGGSTLLLQSSVTATGSFIFTSTNGPLNLGANNTNNFVTITTSGQLGVNSTTPNASARLQIDSTTQGVLLPRMTTTQKNAISTPAAGLMVYDTTLNQMSYYNGTTWINF